MTKHLLIDKTTLPKPHSVSNYMRILEGETYLELFSIVEEILNESKFVLY